jgi:DNA modification methylase
MDQINIFGEVTEKDPLLRDKFIEPPFSVLDSKSGNWQRRKRLWKSLGIKSEEGRDVKTHSMPTGKYDKNNMEETFYSEEAQKLNTSIFDPALCEVLYHWFCKEGGQILDPFAGGSVRGIVANYLGYKYTGIDIREEQIISNRKQGIDILPLNNQPNWIVGDSNKVLDNLDSEKFDFVFSCPPYADLEVYSDLEGDISNMDYKDFMTAYDSIIKKSCSMLKSGSYACFVVGEVRDKKGNYISFVPDTINSFIKAGLNYYNEGILLNAIASASMRADRQFTAAQKLVKVHQNVLVFKKN